MRVQKCRGRPGGGRRGVRQARAGCLCLALVVVWATLCATGCARGRPTEREGGTLVIGVPALPAAIDPHAAPEPYPWLRAIYDTLLVSGSDLQPVAGLATSWRVEAGGREIVLELRPGVVFHDGSKLDGRVVAMNFERLMAGNEERFPVRSLLGPLREVTADGTQVRLIYDQAWPPIWRGLVDPRLGIVSPLALESVTGLPAAPGGGQGGAGSAVLAGSGPYVVERHANGRLGLSRFSAYAWPPAGAHNPGAAYPDRLEIVALEAGPAANGDAGQPYQTPDLVWWTAGQRLPDAVTAATGGWRTYPFAGTRLLYLSIVLGDPVFAEPRVRQALRLTLDPSRLLDAAPYACQPASGLLPSSLSGWAPGDDAPAGGSDAAAGLLESSGWVRGDDGLRRKGDLLLEVRLATYEAATAFEELGRRICQELSRVGFSCRLVPPRRGLPGLVKGGPNLWLLYYEWPDADVLYYLFHSSQLGRANRGGYSNPVADWYLSAARAEPDPLTRASMYRELQAIVLGEGAVRPLFETRGEVRVSPRVAGFRPHPGGELMLHDLYLKNR